MRSLSQLVGSLLLTGAAKSVAQNAQCATQAAGCDAGTTFDTGLRAAIARFADGQLYGGNDDAIVMSSAVAAEGALAMVVYRCQDGSVPPGISGTSLRTSALQILECPNQCGGIALSGQENCGVGVMVAADDASDSPCFSKAVNVIPQGSRLRVKTPVNGYAQPTCVFDSPDARVLVDGSSSQADMTVEKCMDLASDEGWRFAGVEFGIECYWGDEPANPVQSNQQDCQQPCGGDQTEICGNSNRILMYENTDFEVLTRAELGALVQQLTDAVADLRNSIADYHDMLVYFKSLLSSNTRRHALAKRRLTAQQSRVYQELNGKRQVIKNQKVRTLDLLKRAKQKMSISKRSKTIVIQEEEFEMLAREINDPLTEEVTAAEAASDAVAETDVENTAVQQVEKVVDEAVDTTQKATTILGLPKTAVAVATGIFTTAGILIGLLLGTSSGGGGGPTTTVTMTTTTTTTTSTSSTSSCIATATQTPIIILAKAGISLADFKDLTNQYPSRDEKDVVQLTDPDATNFIYITTLNPCDAETLQDNPLVDSYMIDSDVTLDGQEAAIASNKQRRQRPVAADPRPDTQSLTMARSADAINNATAKPIERRDGAPLSYQNYKLQAGSPGNLQWLSAVSRYTGLQGNYYSVPDAVYDHNDKMTSPVIYIIDTFFLPNHEAYRDKIMDSWAVDRDGKKVPLTSTTDPRTSHGTCMASLAAGAFHSMGKKARLVLVEMNLFPNTGVSSRMIMYAMYTIEQHIKDKGLQGQAIITMSAGTEPDRALWQLFVGGSADLISRYVPRRSTFEVYFPLMWSHGVVTLSSAGNNAAERIDAKEPRLSGGATSGHIVVGNARFTNERYQNSADANIGSTFLDPSGTGILSLYNVGTNVQCAVRAVDDEGEAVDPAADPGNLYDIEPPGTSQATAITAGMVAYWMSDPDTLNLILRGQDHSQLSYLMKQRLRDLGRFYKGLDAGQGDGIPRAALGDVVPCTQPTEAGRPTIQPPFLPGARDSKSLSEVAFTEGTQFIYRGGLGLPTAECWNLQ